jgi:predicted Zn finger-like uncharacterized protein
MNRDARVELSMVKVECDGCKAPYQIDEKRIPPTGLKMRCPKCGTNLLVTKPAQPAEEQDLPAPRGAKAPPGPPPAAPPRPAPPRPPAPRGAAAPPAGPPPVPKAPPPVPKAKEPGPFDDPDLPAQRGGFGEIDLMVDLPAPLPAPGGFGEIDDPSDDLPALRGSPPARPVAPGPQTAPGPRRPATQPYGMAAVFEAEEADLPAPLGEADLPAVHGGADLPAARAEAGGFGEIDLPMAPAAAPPRATAARPRGRTVNFGDIDLPAVPEEDDLPAAAPTRGFGEIDLPQITDDSPGLPSPYDHAGLPMAAEVSGFPATAGGAGLPMPAHGAGLPMPAHGAGLPMPAHGAGLPMPAHGAGLPMPAHGGGLPMPAMGSGLPMPAGGSGLPMAAPGGGLPMPAMGSGLPVAAPGGGLPMPATGGGFPVAVAGGGLPMSAMGTGFPAPADVGEELALGDPGASSRRSSAFDDSDRAVSSQMDEKSAPLGPAGIDLDGSARAKVGDEADLSSDVPSLDVARLPSQRKPSAPAETPVKRGNARKVGVAAAVVITLSGGALALVPSIGPFGFNFASDQLNAKSNAASLAELRKGVAAQLAEDTASGVGAGLERCKAEQQRLKRYKPVKAYCAYVAAERGLRFGRRSEDEALTKLLLEDVGDAGGDVSATAAAAADALAGQLPKARQAVAQLAQRSPADEDVAVLAAHIELAAKAYDKAIEAWKRAVSVKRSARTLFGLARAQRASGDHAAAEASAREAIKVSPAHSTARIMLAALLMSDPAREAEALTALKQVTEPGDVSKSSDNAELVEAFTLLGRLHLAKSRISAAEQAFAGALKIDPLAVQALIGNGELFYRSGRYSEALARYAAATQADPENVVAKIGTAKTWIASERMKEAKDFLKKLRESHPADPLVALWQGRAEEALGNKKGGEAAYTEAIKIGGSKPEVVDAYVALAHLLSSVGRTEDANAKLADASQKFPDLAALHRAKGEVALEMGRYQEAKTELEAALAKEDDLGTRFHLGQVARRTRKFDEAMAIFEKVTAVDKDFPGLAIEIGVIYQETGQSEKALALYSEALSKAKNDVDLKLRVGSTQVMAGHAKEAEKLLEEVRKERPNSAEVNHYLGRALLEKGTNLAEAMRYLERAVNIDTNRAEYHLYVGWAANELGGGHSAKAMAELKRAIELDRELGDAYWQRGIVLQREGATKDALADLETALAKRPTRFEAWATIALCKQDLLQWPDAEKAWRQAIAGNDNVPEWHYRLGKLLSGHGNPAASLPELEKATTLGERPEQVTPAWLFDAHLLLAEGYKTANNKPKAIEHYKRFLVTAPSGNVYIKEAEAYLQSVGERTSNR